jgi:hypothetical protein
MVPHEMLITNPDGTKALSIKWRSQNPKRLWAYMICQPGAIQPTLPLL